MDDHIFFDLIGRHSKDTVVPISYIVGFSTCYMSLVLVFGVQKFNKNSAFAYFNIKGNPLDG